MRRIAVALAVAAVVAAPVAIGAGPGGVAVTRFPAAPESFSAGDIIVSVAVWDGVSWQVAAGATLQPHRLPTVCAPVVPGPTG